MRRGILVLAGLALTAGSASAGDAVLKVERIQNGLDLIADVTVRNRGNTYLRGEIECEFVQGHRSVAIGREPLPPIPPKGEEHVWVKVAGRDVDASRANCRIVEPE